jgi:guanosine-3',5'-bis(diphosphate) 3'-pyrophosphohydrolase
MTLKNSLLEARKFAIEAHGEQKYGNFPYSYHLDNVVDIVYDFGEEASIVAQLHDVLEDTKVPVGDIVAAFGAVVATHVLALTDPVRENRKERKKASYEILSKFKTEENKTCLIVKAADRLANVREGVRTDNKHKLSMYAKEHEAFKDAVYVSGLCDEIWKELDNLISYAKAI